MDKKITVLIVDDEPLAREYLRHLLKDDAEIEIAGEAGNGRAAAEFIRRNRPDLVFLDIQMPELDGFSMLRELGTEDLPAIIFTTAFEEYAIRAFEFHALDYLLKPFDAPRFEKALAYAKERLASGEDQSPEALQISALLKTIAAPPAFLERLLIKLNGRIIFVKTDDIDWIKSDDKYVLIYTGKTSHLVRQTLAAMKTQLDPRRFVQIHRSAIINIERIRELEPLVSGEYFVCLESGAKIALSRSYKDELFERLGKPI
jgi:two-component system, LytTR family, response regulator